MIAQVRRINTISFWSPFAVVGMLFGTWAVLGFFESCSPQWSEPIIHCEHSVLFYTNFALGVTVLAGLLAWVTRIIYHPVLPFPTRISELPSALFCNFVIGVVSYGLLRLEFYFPIFARRFFDCLGMSLLICGMLLISLNYLSRKRSKS